MNKHTPGPWIHARDFDENGKRAKVTTIAVCCDFVIGLPAAYEGGNYRDGDPSGDPEADARLIAAAPELLKALESVWLWMESQADGQSKGGHATFDLLMLREQREIARAAIAKATWEAV
jgi:hypothetical protein